MIVSLSLAGLYPLSGSHRNPLVRLKKKDRGIGQHPCQDLFIQTALNRPFIALDHHRLPFGHRTLCPVRVQAIRSKKDNQFQPPRPVIR